VSRERIQSLFQQILDDETRRDAPQAADLARLSAALDGQPATIPETTTARLAAMLDGGLDDGARRDMDDHLGRSPELLQELRAAQAFLDAVDAGRSAAPPELLASTQDNDRRATKAPRPRKLFWTWSAAAFAMALAALAAVIVVTRPLPPTPTTLPPEARTAPPQAGAPSAMLPAGDETVVPAPRPGKIELAPEGPDVMPRALTSPAPP